jgi:hypothetical protein
MSTHPTMTGNPARVKQIRRAALEALKFAGGYALAEETLMEHVSDLVRPPLTYGEWGVTTAFLKDNGHIVPIESEIDPGMKQWAITDRGRTLLATL